MKYKIKHTRDFRGTLGLKHKEEITEINDSVLVNQLLIQDLIERYEKDDINEESEIIIATNNIITEEVLDGNGSGRVDWPCKGK